MRLIIGMRIRKRAQMCFPFIPTISMSDRPPPYPRNERLANNSVGTRVGALYALTANAHAPPPFISWCGTRARAMVNAQRLCSSSPQHKGATYSCHALARAHRDPSVMLTRHSNYFDIMCTLRPPGVSIYLGVTVDSPTLLH